MSGKYGYTDHSGKVREYSYTMGIRYDQASMVTHIIAGMSGNILTLWEVAITVTHILSPLYM